MPKAAAKNASDKVILQLNVHRQFFQAILDGIKKTEYRGHTDYWFRRLTGKKYTHTRFRNGYQTIAPEMLVKLNRITLKDDEYRLHLGEVVSKKNVRLLK